MPLIGARRSILRRSGPSYWTPALLGAALAGWFAPFDLSTVTLGTGIASIASKGGASMALAQSTGANQPSLVSSNTIRHGSNQWLVPSAWPTGAYDFIFAGLTSTPTYRTILWNTSNYPALVVGSNYGVYTTGPAQFGSETWPVSTAGIGYASLSGLNGTPSGARNGGAVAAASTTVISAVTRIGCSVSGGEYWGDFYEIIVTNQTLSTALRQKCEGYLAWSRARVASDMSLVNALIAGHPWKSRAPLMSDP